MQKTDPEMSEEGDRCKPKQPSIPLPLNVVLRNATSIRQVQRTSHEQATVKASEDGCLGWMNMVEYAGKGKNCLDSISKHKLWC